MQCTDVEVCMVVHQNMFFLTNMTIHAVCSESVEVSKRLGGYTNDTKLSKLGGGRLHNDERLPGTIW